MRVLLTGASGFVGPHVVRSLQLIGAGPIFLTAREASRHAEFGAIEALDVTDQRAVYEAVIAYRPECIVHLAGIASPAAASADPHNAWRVHLTGTMNLAHAVLEHAPACSLLFIGTGMVYGSTANSVPLLDEKSLLAPIDDYSATKAAADLALGALAHRGLKCVRLRPFNHTGPGQSDAFMVSSFALQIARIEAGEQDAVIRVGNLDAVRDFLDVRDVAAAYAAVAKIAPPIPAGTILNVASGIGVPARDILNELLALSASKIKVEQDPARLRPIDIPRIVGDAAMARKLLNWMPTYALRSTLADVLADCRQRATQSR